MNRQVLRYSAFASIVLAAVLGIVYFAFLSGTQAQDGGSGDPVAAAQSGVAAEKTTASKSPDALFNEPVGVWNQRERPPVQQPFAMRDAGVVQSAYGEPDRLPANPNASPLPAYGAQISSRTAAATQLTAGATSTASDDDSLAEGAPRGPLNLQNTARGSATELRPSRSAAANSPHNAAIQRAPASQPAAGSHYAGASANAGSGALRPVEPSPLPVAPAYDASGETDSNLHSVVTRSPGAGGSSATISSRGGLGGAAGSTTLQATPAQPHSQYAPPDVGATGASEAEATDDGNHAGSALPSGPNQLGGARAPRGRHPTAIGALSQNPARLQTLEGITGGGRPGSRQVEGKQVPQITIEKMAPDEIQVGKPAKFELHLRNTGTVVAQGVEVHDFVPEGTQFVTANPPVSETMQSELVWTLGALKPGDESMIEVELMPMVEGEVGSVAFVALRAEAGARSRVTKPDLTLQVTAPKQVMIGKQVLLSIEISNPGTGPATGVIIEERVPPGLKHTAGAELEFEVGTLKPGETRKLDLALSAAQAGIVVNQIHARGDGNLQAQEQCELEVVAPALEVALDGPSRRYLERQATYTVSVSNPGTAPAKDVELVTRLPKGLKFVKANNAGHYDSHTHSVLWSLEELPPAETGTVMLTAIPIEPGEQRLRAEGRAKQNLADEHEQSTFVEGLAALLFEVIDVADPIEVKGETAYEVRIMNQGSKAADNVQLTAILPPELRFASAEGPTRHAVKGQQVFFEPLARLAPKADTIYRITVQGLQPGDVRMTIQVRANDLDQPITKEESTRIYSDE